MIRILTDSSTLYSVSEGKEAGIDVSMLTVTINNKTYREFEDIQSEEFVGLIRQGHVPTSSQPALGDVLDIYERYPDDESLNITMADGLSGTYQSACSARDMVKHRDKITVINSRTLCGPHRYLVNKAKELTARGFSVETIVKELEKLIATTKSFLIPRDFDYLRRGGRLSPLMARISKLIHLVPVMTLTEDCRQLTKFSVQRTFRHAIKSVIDGMLSSGVDSTYQISISHSFVEGLAKVAGDMISAVFPHSELIFYPLSPAFTVQGGPECLAIQFIRK